MTGNCRCGGCRCRRSFQVGGGCVRNGLRCAPGLAGHGTDGIAVGLDGRLCCFFGLVGHLHFFDGSGHRLLDVRHRLIEVGLHLGDVVRKGVFCLFGLLELGVKLVHEFGGCCGHTLGATAQLLDVLDDGVDVARAFLAAITQRLNQAVIEAVFCGLFEVFRVEVEVVRLALHGLFHIADGKFRRGFHRVEQTDLSLDARPGRFVCLVVGCGQLVESRLRGARSHADGFVIGDGLVLRVLDCLRDAAPLALDVGEGLLVLVVGSLQLLEGFLVIVDVGSPRHPRAVLHPKAAAADPVAGDVVLPHAAPLTLRVEVGLRLRDLLFEAALLFQQVNIGLLLLGLILRISLRFCGFLDSLDGRVHALSHAVVGQAETRDVGVELVDDGFHLRVARGGLRVLRGQLPEPLGQSQRAELLVLDARGGAVVGVHDLVVALDEAVALRHKLLDGLTVGFKLVVELVELVTQAVGRVGVLAVLLTGCIVLVVQPLQLVVLVTAGGRHALVLVALRNQHSGQGNGRCCNSNDACCREDVRVSRQRRGECLRHELRSRGCEVVGGQRARESAHTDRNGRNGRHDGRVLVHKITHARKYVGESFVYLRERGVEHIADRDFQVVERIIHPLLALVGRVRHRGVCLFGCSCAGTHGFEHTVVLVCSCVEQGQCADTGLRGVPQGVERCAVSIYRVTQHSHNIAERVALLHELRKGLAGGVQQDLRNAAAGVAELIQHRLEIGAGFCGSDTVGG